MNKLEKIYETVYVARHMKVDGRLAELTIKEMNYLKRFLEISGAWEDYLAYEKERENKANLSKCKSYKVSSAARIMKALKESAIESMETFDGRLEEKYFEGSKCAYETYERIVEMNQEQVFKIILEMNGKCGCIDALIDSKAVEIETIMYYQGYRSALKEIIHLMED